MAAKQTKVVLRAGAIEREFSFSHAERLLRMPRSGWEIPEESKFEFVDNGIQRRRNKAKD